MERENERYKEKSREDERDRDGYRGRETEKHMVIGDRVRKGKYQLKDGICVLQLKVLDIVYQCHLGV